MHQAPQSQQKSLQPYLGLAKLVVHTLDDSIHTLTPH